MPDEYTPSDEAQGFGNLFRDRDTRPYCPLCRVFVPDATAHDAATHQGATAHLIHGSVPVLGPVHPPEPPPEPEPPPPTVPIRITGHPGGDEGQDLESRLAPAERPRFRQDIQDALDQGFQPNHLVVSLAYQLVLKRRVQATIEETRAKARGTAVQSKTAQAALREAEDGILKLTTALERIRAARVVKTDDPQEVLNQQSADAERYVQTHIGEFQAQCPGCRRVLTLPVLPHWAFAPHETKDGPEYAVWSPELWALVQDGTLPVHVMAYVLRTSPEGVMLTARRRGEAWPATVVLETEERQLRLLMDRDDVVASSDG